jgi:AAA domain
MLGSRWFLGSEICQVRCVGVAAIATRLFVLDCNPSFAIYTQLALVSADNVVVPFTADDSSRRGIENVVALLYGISADPKTESYARLSFAKRAREEAVDVPKLHTFVSNRVTFYEGKPSKAFEAANNAIRITTDKFHAEHRQVFAYPMEKPSQGFINVPDYHSACVVSSLTGTPLHRLTPGPKELGGERIQLNKEPLDRYRKALGQFVDRL